MRQRVRSRALGVVALALSAAVAAAPRAGAQASEAPEGKAVEYQILARKYDGSLQFAGLDQFPNMALDPQLQAPGVEKPERRVLEDAGAWSSFWKRANPKLEAAAARLSVDFGHDVVLVSAAGTKTSRADTSAIVDVLEFPKEIRVLIEETQSTCPGPREITHPLSIVRIARPHKPIRFDVRTVPCPEE